MSSAGLTRAAWAAMAAAEAAEGLTDMQALQTACAFAGVTLRKIAAGSAGGIRLSVELWPGLHAEISTDNGDGTASVKFTWKT